MCNCFLLSETIFRYTATYLNFCFKEKFSFLKEFNKFHFFCFWGWVFTNFSKKTTSKNEKFACFIKKLNYLQEFQN